MDLPASLRIQARANHLANRRLQAAMGGLARAQLHAPRIGFFPSLMATLNHILAVDAYYVGALHAEADLALQWSRFVPSDHLPDLVRRQAASDARLISCCDRLDAAGCHRLVEMDRGEGRVQSDLCAHVLAHLFMHQTHHRGQVHAMLSGTAVKPPQLDEFMMPSEASLRIADMAALGWTEAAVYGPPR